MQPVDVPFRLRIEAEAASADSPAIGLQVRRNGEGWGTLDAHGFPKPERELKLDFSDLLPGTMPPGWVINQGPHGALSIVSGDADPVLRVNGGESGFLALYPSP